MIAVQRKLINTWPVVQERIQAGELPLRAEGEFALGAGWRKRLLTFDLDPLAYGAVQGEALFHGTVHDALMEARDQSGGDLRMQFVCQSQAAI